MAQRTRSDHQNPYTLLLCPQGLLAADSGMAAGFGRVRFLVLDEADRLLEPTFESELRAILQVLTG